MQTSSRKHFRSFLPSYLQLQAHLKLIQIEVNIKDKWELQGFSLEKWEKSQKRTKNIGEQKTWKRDHNLQVFWKPPQNTKKPSHTVKWGPISIWTNVLGDLVIRLFNSNSPTHHKSTGWWAVGLTREQTQRYEAPTLSCGAGEELSLHIVLSIVSIGSWVSGSRGSYTICHTYLHGIASKWLNLR